MAAKREKTNPSEVLVRTTNSILALALISSGCAQYVHVGDSTPLPDHGTEVRIELAPPQTLELGSTTVHDVTRIEGNVFESEGDSLALYSERVFSAYGHNQYTNGAVFYFDRSQFGRLEERRIMPVRSGITAGAIAVGALAALYLAIELGGGAEGPGSKDAPQFDRVIPIPIGTIVP